jgi:hypothetical protein
LCTPTYHGKTCELSGAGPDLSELDNILSGVTTNYNRMVEAVLNRTNWSEMLVVVDVTGSMKKYAASVYKWMKMDHGPTNPIKYYVFFNDGDGKDNSLKVIGSTGGIYGVSTADMNTVFVTMQTAMRNGNGGDDPENDIEALIFGIQQCPTCLHVIHIADNSATPRDMSLISKVTKPVRVIPCGLNGSKVNANLTSIAYNTSGSVHTLTEDIMTFSKTIKPDTTMLKSLTANLGSFSGRKTIKFY